MVHLTRWTVLGSGGAAMMLAMGIGRFAFTPILPDMQARNGFSDADAGLMAGLNLFGYLLGALWAGRAPRAGRGAVFRAALLVAALCVALMGVTLGLTGWHMVRFAAGVSSGLIFILAAAFVLERSLALGRPSVLHLAGVGIGIALTGLIAGLEPNWQPAWQVLAGISAILALAAWPLGRAGPAPPPHATAAPAAQAAGHRLALPVLAAAYTLEGFGYIISGTFLVSLLRRLPETAEAGPLAWVIVGLAAAPSVFFWAWLSRRIGHWWALAFAYLLQAVGFVLPLTGNAALALISGATLGGTFVGIVGLSFALGATLRPGAAGRTAAFLTVLYSVGQIIGPLLAGFLAGAQGSFTAPLLAAAAAVGGACVLAVIGTRLKRRPQPDIPATAPLRAV